MKKLLLAFLLCATSVFGATQIKSVVTVTNLPVEGDTITVEGDTRTFATNDTASPSTLILLADSIGGNATNLFNQVASRPYSVATVNAFGKTGTNAVILWGQIDKPLTVTLSGTWGTVTYTTNPVTSGRPYSYPIDSSSAETRTNIASDLVYALGKYSTASLDPTSLAAYHMVTKTNSQTIAGQKTFTGPNVYSNSSQQIIGGVISNATLYANGGILSNITLVLPSITSGLVSNVTLVVENPVFTNGVNYGGAFSSPGDSAWSERFGSGAVAANEFALAVGFEAVSSNANATAIGNQSNCQGVSSTAVGSFAAAFHSKDSAFGSEAVARGTNATAIGAQSVATNLNSTAIGTGAHTSADNQVMLGTPTVSVVVNNVLQVGGSITNSALSGQSDVRGDLAFTPRTLTSLANGNNAGIVLGTNVDVYLSGNTTNCAIAGFVAERSGSMHYVIIDNPSNQQVTILNDSGIDSTAANRILTCTGTDLVFAQPIIPLQVRYNTTKQRWIVISGPAYAP